MNYHVQVTEVQIVVPDVEAKTAPDVLREKLKTYANCSMAGDVLQPPVQYIKLDNGHEVGVPAWIRKILTLNCPRLTVKDVAERIDAMVTGNE